SGPSETHRIAADGGSPVSSIQRRPFPARACVPFAAGIQNVEPVAAKIARLHTGQISGPVHDRLELFLSVRLCARHNGFSKSPSYLRCFTESGRRILPEGRCRFGNDRLEACGNDRSARERRFFQYGVPELHQERLWRGGKKSDQLAQTART